MKILFVTQMRHSSILKKPNKINKKPQPTNKSFPLTKKCNCGTSRRTANPLLLTWELFCPVINVLICLDCKVFKLYKIPFKKHFLDIGTILCSKFLWSLPKRHSQACHSSPGSSHNLTVINKHYLAQILQYITSASSRNQSIMTLQFIAPLLPMHT